MTRLSERMNPEGAMKEPSTKKENKICPIDELSTGFHHILWLAENSGKIFLSPLADYTEWMKIFLFIRE